MENSMEVPQKTKNRTTIWFTNPNPGSLSRVNCNSKRYMHPSVRCRTLYNGQELRSNLNVHWQKWIKKMWYILYVDYYSAIKKNEIMAFAATWMNLEIIILSEVRRWKTNIIWYHFYVESKKRIQMNLFAEQKQTNRLWKIMVTMEFPLWLSG